MNEKQLREEIGLNDKELLDTNLGALDIFKVENGIVYYGFLASGNTQSESVKSFLLKAKPQESLIC